MIIDPTRIVKHEAKLKPEDCKTIADVVASMLEQVELQGGDKWFLENFPTEDSFLAQHHGVGRSIRNVYGLWAAESAVCKDAMSYPYPFDSEQYPGWNWAGPKPHPDDVSHLILSMIWKAVSERNQK